MSRHSSRLRFCFGTESGTPADQDVLGEAMGEEELQKLIEGPPEEAAETESE